MRNNMQINATSYYQLPCGKFLEDSITSPLRLNVEESI